MSPPPPSSTLFPYTTLFRSRTGFGRDALYRPQAPLYAGASDRGADPRPETGAPARCRGVDGGSPLSDQPALDRKSTRLNSSHVRISYAVFCLKKKKVRRRLL